MILYHGSKYKLSKISRRQARAKKGLSVPRGELLDAIYFTPDYKTAVAMAARPNGLTVIGDKDDRTISFEQPELFKPDEDIYIYSIDSNDIPPANLRKIDENQYAVVKTDEIIPQKCEAKKSRDVFKYYKLVEFE